MGLNLKVENGKGITLLCGVGATYPFSGNLKRLFHNHPPVSTHMITKVIV